MPKANVFKIKPGAKFGLLTAVSYIGKEWPRRHLWNVVCDCGTKKVVTAQKLNSRRIVSCGCWRIKCSTKHGLHNTKEYRIYQSMIGRCYNPKNQAYQFYGERGITVCDRWRASFVDFYNDMGLRPSANHSVDRINNNGNYEPSNCRWATRVQQSNNTRSNIKINCFGIEYPSISELARAFCANRHTIRCRIQAGWSAEDAVSFKKNQRRSALGIQPRGITPKEGE